MNRRLLTVLAGLIVLGGIGYGIHAWVYSLHHVTTDDAYVESTISPLSAKVAGHVAELRVDDNQSDEARAALEGARVAERTSEAAVDEARAKVEAKRAAMAAMSAEVTGARSSSQQALKEKDRMQRLAQAGYVSQRDFDVADAVAATSAAALDATQRRLTVAEREIQQAEAELAGRVLAVAQARQRVVEAQATLARVESQRHQVTLKESEVVRAEARLTETQADLAFAELQLN